jgi:hypothetical protein
VRPRGRLASRAGPARRARLASLACLACVATSAAALFACNAITGLSEDYRLAGASGEAGAGDAPSAGDGPPTDDGASPTDATPTDAPPDAPPPTGPCADAGPTTLFCADFDDPKLAAPDWGFTTHDTESGAVAVVPGIGKGGTRALRATASTAGGSRQAALVLKLAGLPLAHYDLRFDVYVKTTTLDYLVVGMLGFDQTQSGPYYGLAEHNGGLFDVSMPPKSSDGVGVTDDHAKFHEALLTIDRNDGGAGYHAVMRVDGTLVDEIASFAGGAGTKPVEIRVGAFYTATGAGTAEVVIDNVVVHGD